MHYSVYCLVHNKYNKCYNDGSYHNYYTAIYQLTLGWPRNLINQFVIRFLDIRKYFQFFHLRFFSSTGREARTPDTRFWRPVLYQLS